MLFVNSNSIRVLMLIAGLVVSPSAYAQKPVSVEKLYESAKLAFVEILVDEHMAGSGMFVDKQGYVITAAHVLARPGRRYEVLSPTYGRIKAELVAVDLGHDLALLKVAPHAKGYAALPIAKTTPPVGETCYLIGTPLYRHALLLAGKVARKKAGFEFMPNSKSYAQVYYIAGPSPPGTSGGAWINTKGELVGVQSMLMSVTNSAHGISFVVPPEAVGELLKNKRTASTPSLGMAVEEIWQHTGGMRKKYGQDAAGLFVRASRKGSPAQKAGLKEWELIQSIDLNQFDRAEDFIDYIRAKKKGESVKLSVLAPGGKNPRSVTLQLGDLETNWTSKQTANKTPAKADSSPATKTRT